MGVRRGIVIDVPRDKRASETAAQKFRRAVGWTVVVVLGLWLVASVADDSIDDLEPMLGPLLETPAPDPFVVMADGQPWLFTTNTAKVNVPVLTATPDVQPPVDALPELPPWAASGRTWAPAVARVEDRWVLAFAAHHRASGRQCIGVAEATEVAGPYAPRQGPLVCDVDAGGAIDPSFITGNDGTPWLLWKADGNCCGLPTRIWSARLTPDRLGLAGEPRPLIDADLPWEEGLVEAPTMTRVRDRWLLLYSGNRFEDARYAVGAAWCRTPAGPCSKLGEPVLSSAPDHDGPGGAELVRGASDAPPTVVFHAWPPGLTGPRNGSTRTLQAGKLVVDGDTVSLEPLTG